MNPSLISCLKDERKSPHVLTTLGHSNGECSIFLREQLPVFLKNRKQDGLSYMAQVPSNHLQRDHSEC